MNPLFEVFEGGDFVLSAYRDIEEPLTRMQIFLPDPAGEGAARAALQSALDLVGVEAAIERGEIPAGRIHESAARIRRMKGKM